MYRVGNQTLGKHLIVKPLENDMTKIPTRVWISAVVLAAVLTVAYQLAPGFVIGLTLFISFAISLTVLAEALLSYLQK